MPGCVAGKSLGIEFQSSKREKACRSLVNLMIREHTFVDRIPKNIFSHAMHLMKPVENILIKPSGVGWTLPSVKKQQPLPIHFLVGMIRTVVINVLDPQLTFFR